MKISELRKRIDVFDEKIVRLLNQRADIVLQIGKSKKNVAGEVYVPAREKKVINNILRKNSGPLSEGALLSIYREIMSCSLAMERDMRVAYLGPSSTFTHQAVRSRFGGSVKTVACETIGDVFAVVQKGQADYGVVPIENSTEGAITYTLDEFVGTPLKICAEIYMRISHHLMGNVSRSEVNRILSNPQVFGQCRNWLHREMPNVELVSVRSTAKAAEMATVEKNSAAIASTLAAEIYDLKVLASDIQDLSNNTTRFFVVGKTYGKATGDDKTSILFSVKHEVGALYRALHVFKQYGLNMTKIESRPSKLKAWEYFFFVDIEGHVEKENVRNALSNLEKHCAFMVVLGSYPKQNV